ncbi:hypothetical protein NEMBOFW57_006507 [Staphylotrichum longicolle]|uniref:Ring-like domain-containing protein n=1 Tax=Staphylotrichum longicolle TaxID=669026 RepID=A0AAD4ESY1_9PEZI|nr:hypothetical protein NEMBOFW57_006507 [Staphylotrichum longicolle]
MASFFKKHKEDKTGKAEKAGTGKTAKTGSDDKAQAEDPTPAAAPPAPAADADKRVPLLNDEDEQFLERLVSNDEDDEGPRPPLPPRPKTPDLTWESDSESVQLPAESTATATTTTTATKKPNRLSRLFHRKPSTSTTLTVPSPASVPPEEADREWADLNRILTNLGIQPTTPEDDPATTTTSKSASAKAKAKSAALTASTEIQSLLAQFVLVLRDIMHGAPTAVDDLVALLDGRNDALNRGFEKLPGSMQKLVTQLPKKLTSTLAPEMLAAAAEAQGLKKETDASGLAKYLVPKNLGDLVMTPAIVKSMLKAIVNALKLRWPAFVGTSVLWGTAVTLLLFVLWYCHKRGREEREKREKEGGEGTEGVEGKIEGGAGEGTSSAVVVVEPPVESPRP